MIVDLAFSLFFVLKYSTLNIAEISLDMFVYVAQWGPEHYTIGSGAL